VIWRATRTPEGVATLALRIDRDRVRAAAWGPVPPGRWSSCRDCAAPTTTRPVSNPTDIRSSPTPITGMAICGSVAPTSSSTR
jgi:hypothetical protein